MGKYIVKRLLSIIPVLWFVATITFFLVRLAPGDPFSSEKSASKETIKYLNKKYGMDKPLFQQYLIFLQNLAKGDLGKSIVMYKNSSVNEVIANSFPVSAKLGFFALIYALFLGLFSGIFAASKPNTSRDYGSMFLAMLGICMPSFVIGPMFILIFSVELDWFNVTGWGDAKDIVLPALTLGTMYAAYFARLSRTGILDVVSQDYIRTAHAKGLPGWLIMLRHTLKGGLLPTVSFMGPAVTSILTGSLVVEKIFSIPGIGRDFVDSALNRDYTLVMGVVLFVALLITLMNLVVDIAYAYLDPRVSYD